MNPCLRLEHVSKRYRTGRGLASLRGLLRGKQDAPDAEHHWALKDISLELYSGEALGIIGPNGAGKTTILKILSGVTRPTSGQVHVSGRLSALIELGAGFHPDLTGRENIHLNGTILGMQKAEIKARFDEIVEFAGIGEYLDTPVKRYSSGMYARLGFAIAAHVDPQVLLVDEVLAVGDYAFQAKCHARMDLLRKRGTSLIFVSHNMDSVRRVCDRGLVMYRGEGVFDGGASQAVVAYSDVIRKAARVAQPEVPQNGGLAQRVMTFDAEINDVSLLDANGHPTSEFSSGQTMTLAIDVGFQRDVIAPVFSFFICAPDGRLVYNTTTNRMNVLTPTFRAGERRRVEFSLKLPLLDGAYDVGVDVAAANLTQYYDRIEHAASFWIKESSGAQGLVNLEAQVEFSDPDAGRSSDVWANGQRHHTRV